MDMLEATRRVARATRGPVDQSYYLGSRFVRRWACGATASDAGVGGRPINATCTHSSRDAARRCTRRRAWIAGGER
jgi:hypothetical protein